MLSRFSSLFTYVIVGLVVSAAATPMGPLDLGDGAKSLSHPGSPMKPYDKGKPYGDYKDKSYDGDKRKSYDNDRPKSYDDDMRKSYDGKKGDSYGQCSTGSQHCCNQVNRADESSKIDSLGLLGLGAFVDVIKSSNKLWGSDCSPFLAGNTACSNQPICCQDNKMDGLIVIGCSNIDLGLL
ncbi:hypothetical protein BJV77DRAFT_1066831 [Russula vinacea]|nr:hypothetical protein BJV77DRAFT_1066831 [Russula vinacea]